MKAWKTSDSDRLKYTAKPYTKADDNARQLNTLPSFAIIDRIANGVKWWGVVNFQFQVFSFDLDSLYSVVIWFKPLFRSIK